MYYLFITLKALRFHYLYLLPPHHVLDLFITYRHLGLGYIRLKTY